jgi:hypothetical protein
VRYTVPVLVEVDLDRAEVLSVQVDDERAEGPTDVFAVDSGGMSAEAASRAAEIAETANWPAWVLGT